MAAPAPRPFGGLQLGMRAVAQGRFAAVLAAAEKHLFIRLGGEFYRRDAGVFVAAIAKGLFGRFAASAPKVGFAGLNLDWVGGFLGDDGGVCHGEPLSWVDDGGVRPCRRRCSA